MQTHCSIAEAEALFVGRVFLWCNKVFVISTDQFDSDRIYSGLNRVTCPSTFCDTLLAPVVKFDQEPELWWKKQVIRSLLSVRALCLKEAPVENRGPIHPGGVMHATAAAGGGTPGQLALPPPAAAMVHCGTAGAAHLAGMSPSPAGVVSEI